jgi:hypothetical protein
LARHGRGNPWTSGRAIGGRAQEGRTSRSSIPGPAAVRGAARLELAVHFALPGARKLGGRRDLD